MAEDTHAEAGTVAAIMRPVAEVVHVDHDLDEALTRMKDTATTFLPVVDGDEIVGTLSARRLRERIERPGQRESASVRDVMQTTVTFCYTDDPVDRVRAVMDAAGADHIFALDRDNGLKGIVALDDLAAAGAARDAARHNPAAVAERRESTGGRAKWGAPGGRPATYAPIPVLKRKRGPRN